MSAADQTGTPQNYAQAVPAAPGAPVTPRALVRKAELEAQMAADPADRGVRASYFDHLAQVAVGYTGLLAAHLPEVGTALYLRGGTPDIAVLGNVFRDGALAFPLAATPRRIVVIGAYTGYTAVDLARRHPHAQVLAVEPMADNFRLLNANTAPYRRIRAVQLAAWHSTTRLSRGQRLQADWSVRLVNEAADEERVVPAVTMADLFARVGWSHADLALIDAAGAEREIFADSTADWLTRLDVAVVRIHDSIAPGARQFVEFALPPLLFTQRRHLEWDLFERREPHLSLPPQPPALPLIQGEAGLQKFGLIDVAAATFAFFIYDGHSCQLHPNPPGQRPARAVFPVSLSRQRQFSATLEHAGRMAAAVRFTVLLAREDGTVLAQATETLLAGTTGRLRLDLPDLSGSVTLVLQTEMVAGAPHNQMAWARWVEPKLA